MQQYLVFVGWLLISPFSLQVQEIPATGLPVFVKNTLNAQFPGPTDRK